MTKKMTIGQKLANNEKYNTREAVEERCVEEVDYDSGRWGDTAYVFEDGSGVYEKRQNDFYPLSAQDLTEIRIKWGHEDDEDIMPNELCDFVDLPQGSTYKQGREAI